MGVSLEIIANFGHHGKSNLKLKSDLENSTWAISKLLNDLGLIDRKLKKNIKKNELSFEWIECENIGSLRVFKFVNSNLWIGFHSETCSINLGINWLVFIKESKIRESIRTLTREIVLNCGGSKSLYIPDTHWIPSCNAGNAFHEGKSFEEIEKVLIKSTLDGGSFLHFPTEVKDIFTSHFSEWTYEAFPFLIDVFEKDEKVHLMSN